MLRKDYLIIAFAIISILLGTFALNNIVIFGEADMDRPATPVTIVGGELNTTILGGELNVTIPPEEPQIYKDRMEITVLDWTARLWDEYDYGALIYRYNDRVISAVLPYAFSPKHTFVNTTDLWINVVLTSHYWKLYKFDITFNDEVTITTDEFRSCAYYPFIVSIHVEDPNVLQTIVPGINTLTLSNPMYYSTDYKEWIYTMLWIYKVTVFIEYKYQA